MLVSVIITTYGRTDFLENAIKSVINQDYKDLEIIVVDDNAEKLEVRNDVKNILSKYPQCIGVYNKKNLGGSFSRNEGIRKAKGECIAFLDDDDSYRKDRISKAVKLYEKLKFENCNIGMIYSYVNVVDVEGNTIGCYDTCFEGIPLYQHMLKCLASTSEWFCPKSVLEDVGLFEDTPCKQDSIMLLKILAKGYEVRCIKEKLINYTDHTGNRISGIGKTNIIGLCNLRDWCRKYYGQLTDNQKRDVELSFQKQLMTLYVLTDQRKKAYKCLTYIRKKAFFSKLHLKSAIKYIIGKKYINFIRGSIWKV